MSIRPVEFNGMIQNSHDVALTKANENNRANLQQATIGVVFEQQEQQNEHQVNNMEALDDHAYDREGNGQGAFARKNKKKKEKGDTSMGDGKVFLKNTGAHQSFDVKI